MFLCIEHSVEETFILKKDVPIVRWRLGLGTSVKLINFFDTNDDKDTGQKHRFL